jgi:tetratricopeptide (TPR) repeat protein
MNFDNNIEINNLIPDASEIEAEEMFANADQLLNEGVLKQAVDVLTQIIKRNPQFGKAYNHLGWVYETKYKNAAKAEEYYKAAMQLAPHYNASYLNYSYLLSNQQRFDELKAHLDKISNIQGIAKDTIANEYAVMYEMQGNINKAIEHYKQAAMITLDTNKLAKYKDGIERCDQKLALLNPTDDFVN